MEYLYFIFSALFLLVIGSFITYKITKRKLSKLFLLDKRQQGYIKDLVNYDTRLAVLQKLFFCVILTICKRTHKYGVKQLNKHFNIPIDINNADELINYFISIYNKKNISFNLQSNGKYTIITEQK